MSDKKAPPCENHPIVFLPSVDNNLLSIVAHSGPTRELTASPHSHNVGIVSRKNLQLLRKAKKRRQSHAVIMKAAAPVLEIRRPV